MRSFFKIVFASLLSLFLFSMILLLLAFMLVGSLASKSVPEIESKSVLVLDLGQDFHERKQESPLGAVTGETDVPGLFDVLRLIDLAGKDRHISGIYVKADQNANGFASSNEIRNALAGFRHSGKWVIAQGDDMSQKAYFVAAAADKVYVNPSGAFDWKGFNVAYVFIKQMLDKLEIQPQIFYAGKFKSATEMFRTDKMTPENRLQTSVWLGDLYNYFLVQTAARRGVDTATLHQLANTAAIQTPQDALDNHLIDGVKYDDQIKDEMKARMGLGKYDRLNLVSMSTYYDASILRKTGSDRIAVIYAEGDIVDGEGRSDDIGGERYRAIIRKARLDKSVKAIVLRVNSGGGSALASDIIWRELQMARKDKPVVVSMGDVAASGGYYISCGADSVFAEPTTITGSIGVFSIIPNMGTFFKNKLGVTFDEVNTAPYADVPSVYKPLDPAAQKLMQNSVERIYSQFKQRVSAGRKKDTAYIETIAQGHVWSGLHAVQNGLVDRLGNLQDAINAAAHLAKTSDYGIREYPESAGWLQNLLNKKKKEPESLIKEQLGEENYQLFRELEHFKSMTHSVQARMPFQFVIN